MRIRLRLNKLDFEMSMIPTVPVVTTIDVQEQGSVNMRMGKCVLRLIARGKIIQMESKV